MAALTLQVDPPDGLIDVARTVRVAGAPASAPVRVRSRTTRAGLDWTSEAVFQASAQGTVDLAHDAPLSGTYSGVAPMGLLWSQRCPTADWQDVFNHPVSEPLVTHLEADAPGVDAEPARATLTQRLMAEGVTRRDVRERGLVGTLFMPATPGPYPAVMVLNGSGGGINEPRAALLASRGYAAFALAYFRAPGLSPYISNTPLEYFKTGLDWLRETVRPTNGFVALSGQSRGGELVLLLGATYPRDVSAVLAYVPGAVVHSGQSAADPAFGREGPSWLLNGQPLTHVWQDNRTATWAPYDHPAPGRPKRHADAILTALQDPDAVARARIRVEDIQAPVLLLSGTDDGAWPSSLYSRMVRDKLTEVQHPHVVQWIDVEGAGHAIAFPYVPTTQIDHVHPVSGLASTMGGNPAANARANELAWAGAQDFLREAVARHNPVNS